MTIRWNNTATVQDFLIKLGIKPSLHFFTKSYHRQTYTITYKSSLTQKNGTKKPMLFSASMGKMGLSHDIFFKFSVGPFEVVEVE